METKSNTKGTQEGTEVDRFAWLTIVDTEVLKVIEAAFFVAGEFPEDFVAQSDLPDLTWEAIDKELVRRGGKNWESTL